MRNYNPFLLFFLVAVFFIRSEAEQKTTHLACKISREYITTHKYLSEKLKDYGLESQQIDLIANKVSVGCTGAASRFIRSLKFLSQVEVGTREAIQISTELSNKTDQHTEVFLKVFKRSYFKSSLDLDLSTSLSFAKALSLA